MKKYISSLSAASRLPSPSSVSRLPSPSSASRLSSLPALGRLCCGVAAALALLTALAACSGEDALEPSFSNPSLNFQPAADDQSAEAQLRRQFQSETGTYLLFNDTIQHQFLGNDINGQPRYFTETVDLTYAVGQSASVQMLYSYTYLQTIEQKQQMTDFLRQYILPHLTQSLKPYSWFVCNVITSRPNSYTAPSRPYAASNQRCVAIAANYLIQRERTDQQKQQYAQRILNAIVGQLAVNQSAAFSEFYKFSADYYSSDYSRHGYTGTPSTPELYKLGFLGSTAISSFPSMTTDLSTYALLVIQYTDEQLASQYANYPLVLQKAAIVRRVLISLGYVF